MCTRSAPLALFLFVLAVPAWASWVSPFISEIHYDNAGGDVGEFVAVTGPAGQDLTDWQIVLYNGADGTAYRSQALSGVLGDAGPGWSEVDWSIAGLQNGPDAVALVSADQQVVDFVAYEAMVTATSGVAAGLTARLLPVEEGGGTDIGLALQRIGGPDEWIWQVAAATPGSLNSGLLFDQVGGVPVANVGVLWLVAGLGWLALAARRWRLTPPVAVRRSTV